MGVKKPAQGGLDQESEMKPERLESYADMLGVDQALIKPTAACLGAGESPAPSEALQGFLAEHARQQQRLSRRLWRWLDQQLARCGL